ncbi:MAG: hypothetical protein KIH62_004205 [Candidatus Kerfeldbacteria bacterium]|nr:hypothetical protein [Candidatus Kerfeldbacteria bacterium]
MQLSSHIRRVLWLAPHIAVVLCVALPVFADTVVNFQQTILPGPNSIDVVDDAGEIVAQPRIDLSPTVISSVLGTSKQKLRIMNPARDVEWSVTIAPVDGPRSLWKSSGATFDTNDTSDIDGPDTDTSGGRLSIDPSLADIESIVDPDNCPTSDLSLGTPSSFSEYDSAFSSISLVSGSARLASYCGWDISGIRVQQTLPYILPESADPFHLHLVITIM